MCAVLKPAATLVSQPISLESGLGTLTRSVQESIIIVCAFLKPPRVGDKYVVTGSPGNVDMVGNGFR